LGGGGRGTQWGRNNFKNHTDGDGLAGGKRDFIRPNVGFLDAKRRHSVGIRILLLDNVDDGPGCRHAQRERDFYACRHN
jgi:hypothetical protein